MTMHSDCFYCTKDQRLQDLMMEVCQLSISTLYLLKDQTYRGRCVVAYKDHKNELFELTEEELILYTKDVARVASTLNKIFSPDKLNYGIYGDRVPHVHTHLVPKYEGSPDWGGSFEVVRKDRLLLSSEEYEDIMKQIKENL